MGTDGQVAALKSTERVTYDSRMAKTMAGVLAVSIAALLFAGCGSSSSLSPAQKARCEELARRMGPAPANSSDFERCAYEFTKAKTLENDRKEAAAIGC
jgi:hypothetical protein